MSELGRLLRNKTFRKFIISFISVFLIPLVVLVFVFDSLTERMRGDVKNKEYLIGEQLKSSLDSQLFALMEIANKLTAQKNIIDYAQDAHITGGYLTDRRFQTLRALSDELVGLRAGYNSLLGGYLYTSDDDRIFSTMGLVDSQSYYRVSYRTMEYYSEWKTRLDSRIDSHLFAVGPPAYLTGEGNISYGIVFWYNYDRPVTFVLNMNTSLLRTQAKSLAEQGSHMAIVHLTTREMIYTGSPLFMELYASGELLGMTEDLRQVSTSQGEMMLSYHPSQQTGCAYFIMTPKSTFYLQVDRTSSLFLVTFGIMLLFGVCLIFLLSRRAYRPIGDLRFGLTDVYAEETDDDFTYIKNAISRISSDKSTMELQLYHQSNRMRDLLISRLIYGRYRSDAIMREDLNNVGIKFESEFFVVLLVWSDAFLNSDNEEEVFLQQFVISNVFTEILSDSFATYPVMLEAKTGFLLNLPGTPSKEDSFQALKQQIEKAIKIYAEHFDTKIYASVSRVHEGLFGIRRACTEAEGLIETTEEDNSVVYAEPASQIEMPILPGTVEETCNKLENLLLLGDGAAASELIRNELAAMPKPLPGWKKSLMRADLGLCMLRLLTPANFERQQLLELDRDLGTLLDKGALSTEDLCEIAQRIASYAKYRDPRTKDGTIEARVEQYIACHYSDPMLSASSIAEHLGLHVNYLSSLYKKRTGESVLQMIGVYRMNHAKELLAATSKKIEDIAVESGFYNSPSFIRTFKRYEGITPGQYRAMQQTKEESF